MVQIIISIILGIVTVYKHTSHTFTTDAIPKTLIALAVGLAVTNFIPWGKGAYVIVETDNKAEAFSIVALQDNNQVAGTKYVGIGHIQEKMYYCFYEETDQGYKYHKLSPEDYEIYIKECSEDEKPYIEEMTKIKNTVVKKDPSSLFWFSLYEYSKYKNCKIGDIVDTSEGVFPERTYTIFVPKGTIVEDYQIDME